MTVNEGLSALTTKLPIWVGLVAMGIVGAGTAGNTMWNQNNEPRFDQIQSKDRELQQRLATMERSYATLAMRLSDKVDRRERKEMLDEIKRRFTDLERAIRLLETRHMRRQYGPNGDAGQ